MRPKPNPVGTGQESVWDYPRPPRLEPTLKNIKIVFQSIVLAATNQAWRVLETSHPPVYYLPTADVQMQYLVATSDQSFCEWKGQAIYYDVVVGGKRAAKAGWSYLQPTLRFQPIQGYVAFYAQPMDACYVADELVTPQPGGFYGGWITQDIAGPFKGEPGSWGW